MSFSLKNTRQSEELFSQLQLGQIIQVQVLEKAGVNQYLISYKNIELTAVSEVDLFSKSVWLKVTQKSPFPKLQLIIEENESNLKGLLEYTVANNLSLPPISNGLKGFLTSSTAPLDTKVLFDFLGRYYDKITWSIFNESVFLFLLKNGVSVGDLSEIIRDMVYLSVSNDKINNTPPSPPHSASYMGGTSDDFETRILTKKTDLEGLDKEVKSKLTPLLIIIERVNEILGTQPSKLQQKNQISFLYLRHPLFHVALPIESMIEKTGLITSTGTIKTKHFGQILLKYNTRDKSSISTPKEEINLYFENNIFINSMKNDLEKCVKDKEIVLRLGLQTSQVPQYYNPRDWI